MSTTFIAMFVAILLGLGLLGTIGVLSLLSGTLNFLFVNPRLIFLKRKDAHKGFAFGYTWDQEAEEVTFNRFRIQYLNPFGEGPKHLEVIRDFDGLSSDGAVELDLGETFHQMFALKPHDQANFEITLFAKREGVSHTHSYKSAEFIDAIKLSSESVEDFNKKFESKKPAFEYKIPERSFISPALPKSGKSLKIATNPEFSGQFQAQGSADSSAVKAAVENFSVSKVWIEPGCIVCNACEGIFPEVFEVTTTTCLIRPNAPLNDGLKIKESAEACPVEVIKFTL